MRAFSCPYYSTFLNSAEPVRNRSSSAHLQTNIADTSHTEEANNHIDENGNPIQDAEIPFGKTGRAKSYKVFDKDTDLFCVFIFLLQFCVLYGTP